MVILVVFVITALDANRIALIAEEALELVLVLSALRGSLVAGLELEAWRELADDVGLQHVFSDVVLAVRKSDFVRRPARVARRSQEAAQILVLLPHTGAVAA